VATATQAATSDAVAVETPAAHSGRPNRLINEKSPYLLQHAYNPVDWYPWGKEAFEKARKENKPIFLSIGYSTCHWCHVMEAESFEDEEVARLMNETFVSIKVDREERPDIDNIYMGVAMLISGSGGWPLNIIMTPDQKPFFAATYIPKESRFGRAGLLDLTTQVHNLWLTEPEDILDLANQVTDAIQRQATAAPGEALDATVLEATFQQLASRFDPVHGGFGTAPKFPTPHHFLFLLRYWHRTGDDEALAMVEISLQAMRRGGIYDHIGYGFHRYSTDAEWFKPHFEKMLYDQALLAIAYTEAYLATGKSEYEQTTREILTYVLRDMTDPQGGFYSAEDADSEGEEGKFYTWTEKEIRQHLVPAEADFVLSTFHATADGKTVDEATAHRPGTNILHLTQPLGDNAAQWETARQALFEVREKRIHPHKDDKMLTDWNGLMIAALAKAAQAFHEPLYTDAAVGAAEFILSIMRDESGRLLHRYRDGEAAIQATIEDYAFFTWSLIDLYETTFDVRYLQGALLFQDQLITRFWDEANGGFYLTADDGEPLLTRPKTVYDGAIPSGNSVAMLNLLRLGRITGNADYEQRAALLGRAFARDVRRAPMVHTQLVTAVDFGVGPSLEVVIVGEVGARDTETMLAALRQGYFPNKVVLWRPPGDDAAITDLAEFTRYQTSLHGQATAYVCLNYHCKQPTTDVATMLSLVANPSR